MILAGNRGGITCDESPDALSARPCFDSCPSTCYQTFGRLFNFFQNFHFVKHKLIESLP